MNKSVWTNRVGALFVEGAPIDEIARLFPPAAGVNSQRRAVVMALMGRDAIYSDLLRQLAEEGVAEDEEAAAEEEAANEAAALFEDRYPELSRVAALSDQVASLQEAARAAEEEARRYSPPTEWAWAAHAHAKGLAEARRLRREAGRISEELSTLTWELHKELPADGLGHCPSYWLEVDTSGLLWSVSTKWDADAPIWGAEERQRLMDEALAALRDAPPQKQEGALIVLANSLGRQLTIE